VISQMYMCSHNRNRATWINLDQDFSMHHITIIYFLEVHQQGCMLFWVHVEGFDATFSTRD